MKEVKSVVMPFASRRIQSLRSSLKSAKLIRAKSKIKQLAEKKKKLKEDVKRAKEKAECSKQILELKANMMVELWTYIEAGLKEASYRLRRLLGLPGSPEGAAQLSKKKRCVVKFYEGIDCFNCTICLEPWTRSGLHDICSLSYGHFFGKSCITDHILRNGSHGFSSCPVCSSIATLSNIRCHHASQINDGEVEA